MDLQDVTFLTNISDGLTDDYSKAMTLRDCVMFVRGSLDAFEDTADIRLADLDFKHPHPDKVAKWTSTERVLIDQGWYSNVEIDGKIDSTCLLTRRSL
jgi:inositol-pentakisphosphate 2-kinase